MVKNKLERGITYNEKDLEEIAVKMEYLILKVADFYGMVKEQVVYGERTNIDLDFIESNYENLELLADAFSTLGIKNIKLPDIKTLKILN